MSIELTPLGYSRVLTSRYGTPFWCELTADEKEKLSEFTKKYNERHTKEAKGRENK